MREVTISNISITLEYQMAGSNEWMLLTLLPEQYFDLDPGEEIQLDCVPKHNHAVDYLDFESTQVKSTKLKLLDMTTNTSISIVETFWNEGKNRAIERIDAGPNENYWELILDLQIQDSPLTWEILRIDKRDGIITPNYHGFIQHNEDGSETEIKRFS